MLMNLPRNLAALCKVATREDLKFATTCIHLLDEGNGLYRAEATDGRVLAIIMGPFDAEAIAPAYQRPFEADAVSEVLLPAKEFGKAVSKCKATEGPQGRFQLSDLLLLTNGLNVGVCGQDGTMVLHAGSGRFPNTDMVIPKRSPLLRIPLNPKHLITLLQAAQAVNEDRVEVLYYKPGLPLGVIAVNEHGQAFDGLIVPLIAPKESGPRT